MKRNIKPYSPIDGLRYFKKLVKGNKQGFHFYYDHCWECVFIYCKQFVEVADAEYCTSHAFVQLWKQRGILQAPDPENARMAITDYLLHTARLECNNVIRRQHSSQEAEALILAHLKKEGEYKLVAVTRSYFLTAVREKLQTLSKEIQEVFELCVIEKKTTTEIARQLQLTEEKVIEIKQAAAKALKLSFIAE